MQSRGNRRKLYNSKLAMTVNMAPFVDVLFVLLIAFMIVMPATLSGVNVKLPRGTIKPISIDKDPVTITVTDGGDVYLQDDIMKLSQLPPRLGVILGNNFESTIYIKGHKDIDYGRVMDVMRVISDAGFTNVSLVGKRD